MIDEETGLPIANVNIHADALRGGSYSYARTDRNGSYTLRGIPAGLIEVFVSGQGYVGVGQMLTVAAGENVTGFDF